MAREQPTSRQSTSPPVEPRSSGIFREPLRTPRLSSSTGAFTCLAAACAAPPPMPSSDSIPRACPPPQRGTYQLQCLMRRRPPWGVSYLVGGIGLRGAPLADVVSLRLAKLPKSPPPPMAGSVAGVFPGNLLIADRGNNRLLLVNPQKKVLWSYPGPGRPAPVGGFYFPDDAFFTHHGSSIISNEEQNETIVQIAFPSGKVIRSYGHPRTAGTAPGFCTSPTTHTYSRTGRSPLPMPRTAASSFSARMTGRYRRSGPPEAAFTTRPKVSAPQTETRR